MVQTFLHALAVALFAAVAVDFGFRVAFIDDTVAYLVTVYVCVLLALLVGRNRGPLAVRRMLWRLPVAVMVALGTLVSLRSWALFEIPIGRTTTTGHSPYVVLSACALITTGIFEGISRWLSARAASSARATAVAPVAEALEPSE